MQNYKLLIAFMVVVGNSLPLHGTTYTFIGTAEDGGDPLYQNIDNWENALYPGTTINAGDTVIITAQCVNNLQELHVYGFLKVEASLDGQKATVFESGSMAINGSVGNPITARGIVSGNGVISAVLICEGCTLYPGEKDQIGGIHIQTLLVSGPATIEIDVIGQHTYDIIFGNATTISAGELVLNYTNQGQSPANCTNYEVFQFKSEEELNFSTLRAIPYESLLVEVNAFERIAVAVPFEGDRALHFDGVNDHIGVSGSMGALRTIEFRFTPDQAGPSEPGQMLFHFNHQLLEYVIINSTTSSFDGETLTIKNDGGVGANSLYTKYDFVPGETYHVAITANANDEYELIYVNGDLVQTFEGNGLPPVYEVEHFFIGQRNQAFYYKGKMDEIRLWSDIRTAQEISDNSMGYLEDGDTQNLISYYKFDQGVPYDINSCIETLSDEVSQKNTELSGFSLSMPNQSNWAHAGCRVLNTPFDVIVDWSSFEAWMLSEVPNISCHDVILDFKVNREITISPTTQAESISLEVEGGVIFTIQNQGTLEVTGN